MWSIGKMTMSVCAELSSGAGYNSSDSYLSHSELGLFKEFGSPQEKKKQQISLKY